MTFSHLSRSLIAGGRHQSRLGFLRCLIVSLLLVCAWGYGGVGNARWQPDGRDVNRMHPIARFGGLTHRANATSTTVAPTAASTPLECFEVAEPVLTPTGDGYRDSCSVVLMKHSFANSYGSPYVGNYTPPSCDFDHVVINFTAAVKGRQFDRTAFMYLGDTEIWRTSTAEPTAAGIYWFHTKDMTPYLSLWKEPQTVIFALDNVVNDIYTGIINTTIIATFFKRSVETAGGLPADLIIPVTSRQGSSGTTSYWTLPEQNATRAVKFPQHANRAVFSIAVKGQGNEEFFWNNVPQSAVETFNATYGSYPGYSAWREFQIFVDGQLAGMHWPFPTIYTGGVVPQLHRPIVGIDAFDLREHEIDFTPWLPYLCDGKEHNISVTVVGLDDNGVDSASVSSTVESSWYVAGKVFVWLDDDEHSVTTGTVPTISSSTPTISFSQSISQNSTGSNETLIYNIAVSRNFAVSSTVSTQTNNGTATWSQTLSYSNAGSVYAYGYDGLNDFITTGLDSAQSPGLSYSTNYKYPLWCNSTSSETPKGNLTLWAILNQGLDLEVEGNSVYPTGLEAFPAGANYTGSYLNTQQNGEANYHRSADQNTTSGVGYTNQVFYLGGLTGPASVDRPGKQLYYRNVTAYNNTVISDHEVVADESQ